MSVTAHMYREQIIEDIYQTLQGLRTRGLELPEAIGLTKRELELMFGKDITVFFNGTTLMPMTIWGHKVIMLKG
jgi:hypothetical protein